MKPVAGSTRPFLMILGLCTMLSLSATSVVSQSMEDLNHLKGHKANIFYSTGSKDQAESIAERLDKVMSFYKTLVNFEPEVTLLVLSPDDWSKYTAFPVYGMPHYTSTQTLIVASEDNDFWKSQIPPLDQMPAELAQKASETYTDVNNTLTLQGFFDLLAIHELGHAYHMQGGLDMQRLWMGELFSNIFLHTYIAEIEPEFMPALTVFPEIVVSITDKNNLKYTTLEELESSYNIIASQYPNNYGWYQCRWHKAAGEIYDDGGVDVVRKLWLTLKEQEEHLDDAAFVKLLSESVHQSVADVQRNWDK